MGDSDNASPANGEQPNRILDQTSSNRPPLNETSMRTGERTCTQKLSIPSLEKYDSSSANLWWRKFVQYVKMTKDIGISPMVNSKRNITTISGTKGNRDERHIPMGNRTKRTYRNSQDVKRKRTELSSTTQTLHYIPATLHDGTKCTA